MSNFDWMQLLNPEFYITMSIGGVKVGLWIVLFIVFAETGLFAGFFLPVILFYHSLSISCFAADKVMCL